MSPHISSRRIHWNHPGATDKTKLVRSESSTHIVGSNWICSSKQIWLPSKTRPISPQKHEPAVVAHTLIPGLGSTWLSMSSRLAWYLVSSRPAKLTLWDSVSKTDKWLILCILRRRNLICESQQNIATVEMAPEALSSQAKQGRAENHHHYFQMLPKMLSQNHVSCL